jgi:hypothetical protein
MLVSSGCTGVATADGGTGGGGATSTGGGSGAMGGGAAPGGGSSGGTGGGSGAGTGGGGSAGDAGLGPSLTDFCNQYPAAICAVKVACGLYSDAGFDVCMNTEGHNIADWCGRADAGAVQYFPASAQQCLDETKLSPPSCLVGVFGCGINEYIGASPFSADPNECGGATCAPNAFCNEDCNDPQCLTGRQIGQSCEEGTRPYSKCDTDAGYCLADDGGYGGPTAVCRPFPGLGMPCPLGICGPGQQCTGVACQALLPRDAPCTNSVFCFDEVCRPIDGRCGTLDAGAPCISGDDCSAYPDLSNLCVGLALAPDGGVADAGVCGPRPKHGDSCSADWSRFINWICPPGDSCLDGKCRTLTPFTAPAGSECVIRPFGDVLAPFFGFAYCQPGLECMPAADAHPPQTGRCGTPLPLGAPCRDLFNCASLFCSNPDGGPLTCQPISQLHEPCGECVAELTCTLNRDAGTHWCAPRIANGDNCPGFATCAGGYCDAPDYTCHAYSTGACGYGYQCESGWCSGGQCAPVGTCRASY